MVIALKLCGWTLTHIPEWSVKALAWLLGSLLYYGVPWRVRIAHSNLHHAFPEKSIEWRQAVARQSCQRLVEMTLFALASPFFDRQRVQRCLEIPMDLRVAIAADQQDGVGSVFLIPHFTLAEMTAMCPVIDPIFDGTLVLFRPLNQRGINAWVKRVRERWGCSFVSRKEDLLHLHEKLKQGGKAAILFDQNAGRAGLLFPFFGRLISATHLPGLLAERHGAASFVAYPKRTGFWRATIAWKRLEPDLTAEQIAFAAHDHLADYLSQSIDQCADWLWLHNRWKNALTHFKSRFRLDSRKLRLKEYLAFHGQAEPSKRTRYWFRLPSSREQINSVERYLHAVAKARPDVEITLLGHPEEIEVTSAWAWLPKRLVIPQSAIARCSFIRKMRREYADLYICLSDQTKDIRLGWLLGIPQRFGWPTGSWSDQFSTQTAPSSVKSSDEWDSFFSVFGLSHQAYP